MRYRKIAIVVLVLVVGAALVLRTSRRTSRPREDTRPQIARAGSSHAQGIPSIRISPATVAPAGDMQLSGRIVSRADGAGIGNAEITFVRDARSYSAVSAPDGAFQFEPPEPGSYQLAAVSATGFLPFAPAWGDSPLVFTARSGTRIKGVSIELDPEKTIVAKIVGPTGSPVSAATVTLDVVGAERMELFSLPSPEQSDEHGAVRFRVPIGTIVEARHPAFDPARERVTAEVWRRGELTLQLKARSSNPVLGISGKVIDAKEIGMPAIRVIARRSAADPFSEQPGSWSGLSSSEGNFEIAGLPEGQYTLTAASPGLVPARVEAVPAGGKPVVLQLREDGGWLSGRVVSRASSKPVASFVVVVAQALSKLEERPVQARSYFDPDGRFLIGPFEPGSYVIHVAASGYAPSMPGPVQLTAGNTSELEVPLSEGGSLTGTVADAVTGKRISGARIELEGNVIAEGVPMSIENAAATDRDGTFALRGIPAGVHSVRGSAPGFNARVVSGIQVTEGSAAGPVDIQLTPLAAAGAEAKVEITGIGAALAPQGELLLVGNTVEGGGAAEAGIVSGDRILAIDGTAVGTLEFAGAIERIRGPVGSSVSLVVRRHNGQDQTITVVRRLIKGPAPPAR